MSEVLAADHSFDPLCDYNYENYPSIDEQTEFFRCALQEGAALDRPARTVKGPYFDKFREIMSSIGAGLQEIHPDLTAEHIAPFAYQSLQVREQLSRLTDESREAVNAIRTERMHMLGGVATQMIETSPCQIPRGCFSEPPYCRQKEDWKDYEAVRGCTNACFRMIFGGIAGWVPSQAVVSRSLIEQYHTSVVDDSVYCNLLQSEVFEEISGRKVVSVEVMGADLGYLEMLATKLKERSAGAEVYCMVNLDTRGGTPGAWHTCVLLDADEQYVKCHDPSNTVGGENRLVPQEVFAARWAQCYNRAQLIIAR